MLWVGLSGGIGSGKSTVSARLAELGAVVIDADRIAREVVEPGTPALAEITARFGPGVLMPDGALDRPALGAVVFGDPAARADLEAITHPRIFARTGELRDAAPDDAVVVHDIPLLVELDRAADYALTVIVDVPEEVRLRRLVDLRGMAEDEARSRIAAQADDDQRRRAADVLLPNTGSLEELRRAVDRLWEERLVPFEAALRDGRPAARRRADAEPEVVDQEAQVDRLLARVGRALGEHLVGLSEPARGTGSAASPGALEVRAVVRDAATTDAAGLRQRLARAGLLAVPTEPTGAVPTGLPRATLVPADPALAGLPLSITLEALPRSYDEE